MSSDNLEVDVDLIHAEPQPEKIPIYLLRHSLEVVFYVRDKVIDVLVNDIAETRKRSSH